MTVVTWSQQCQLGDHST